MALPQPQQYFRYLSNIKILVLMLLCPCLTLQSCSHKKQVYKSECDNGISFQKISFNQLIDSISRYDQQYIEVSGKYLEDKDVSALFSESTLTTGNGLWVNFSQDCPLYLAGTRHGLFEYNDGQYTQLNNRLVTIRGRIDVYNKGNHKKYKATIDRVSLVKL